MGCVSHHALCQPPGGHHSAESISAVCITLQSQFAHRRDKLHTADSESKSYLWLHVTGQSWKISLRVSIQYLSCTLRSQNFRTKWSNILAKLKPNYKILKPFYQGPGWVRFFFMNKKLRWKISWHAPFKDPMTALYRYCMNLCGSVCSVVLHPTMKSFTNIYCLQQFKVHILYKHN